MKDPMLRYVSKEAAPTAPEQIKNLKEDQNEVWWALLVSGFSSEKPRFTALPRK
ncbi:MAG: hypothetical protein K6F57_04430 [Candidatus Saccharibacteria bacterium]|nr:hypothetical protein [Candidatus Saccharibacteria bacterium]